ENENVEETTMLKEKHLKPIKQFKHKFSNSIQNRLYNPNKINPNYQSFDIYADKKDSILDTLNQKVRYFFIRNTNGNIVKFTMDNCITPLSRQNLIKYKEAKKSCDDVIFIMF